MTSKEAVSQENSGDANDKHAIRGEVPIDEVWATHTEEHRHEIAHVIAALMLQVAKARHKALYPEAQSKNE